MKSPQQNPRLLALATLLLGVCLIVCIVLVGVSAHFEYKSALLAVLVIAIFFFILILIYYIFVGSQHAQVGGKEDIKLLEEHIQLLEKKARNVKYAPKKRQSVPQPKVAIIFTDVQNSTGLWEQNAEAMRESMTLHHNAIREVIQKHKAYEVKTIGDSFMITSESADTALNVSTDIQSELLAQPWPEGILDTLDACVLFQDQKLSFKGLRVRIGIDIGCPEIVYDEVSKGYDYYGDTANIAARVEAMAHGGQTLITERLQAALSPEARKKYDFVDLGGVKLRGITGTTRVYQVNTKDLVREFAVRNTIEDQRQTLLALTKSESIDSGARQEAFQEICKSASTALRSARVSIWFYDTEKAAIVCEELYESDGDKHSSGVTLYEKDFPGYFAYLHEERILAAHDAHTDIATKEFSVVYLTPLGINSMLDAPIRFGGKLWGVVCCEHIGMHRTWTMDEQTFGASMADFTARALAAERQHTAQRQLEDLNAKIRILSLNEIESQLSRVMMNVSMKKFSRISAISAISRSSADNVLVPPEPNVQVQET